MSSFLPASKKVVSPAKKERTVANRSRRVLMIGRFRIAWPICPAASATRRPMEVNIPEMKFQTPTTTSRAQRNGVARKS